MGASEVSGKGPDLERIATWARHEQALAALRRTLEVLDGAEVPVLVVKGMVLAYSLYDDVANRPLADVDLRLRPRDYLRSIAALRRSGLEPHWESKQLGAVSFLVDGALVEIETSVGPPGLCALTVAQMLDRAQPRVLGGGLRVLAPELHDHVVLMVVNAFKDKMLECPSWSLDDLDALAERVDAEVFVARVAEARIRRITWIVADFMAETRGSARWRELQERLGFGRLQAKRARAYRARIQRKYASAGARVLARIASDSPARAAWSLIAGAAGVAVHELAAAVRDKT